MWGFKLPFVSKVGRYGKVVAAKNDSVWIETCPPIRLLGSFFLRRKFMQETTITNKSDTTERTTTMAAIYCVSCVEVMPGLYLSRFPKAIPSEMTHVLNMCVQPHPVDTSRTYLHIPIDDIDDITPQIPKIIHFISHALADDGKVLVHCALGINRSAAAVVSFLCSMQKVTASQATEQLKIQKPDVKLSVIFLGQIDRYYGRQEEKEDPLSGGGGFTGDYSSEIGLAFRSKPVRKLRGGYHSSRSRGKARYH
jgi:protein-tyrosine phosphatase